MKIIDRGVLCCAIIAGAALAACSSDQVNLTAGPTPTPFSTSASSPTPAPPTLKGAVIAYTAIGASDAVGYGASVPCANPPLVAVPACPGGTGYVPVFAGLLATSGAAVTLNDLGISGAVIGPDIKTLGNTYGSQGSAGACKPRVGGDLIPSDFITDELPNIKGNETLVTIFAGGNDTNAIVNAAVCLSAGGATQAQVTTFLTSEIAAFGVDFTNLVMAIHAKAPNATILAANLPNFAGIPYAQAPTVAPAKALLQAFSVGIDTSVYQPAATGATPPVEVVDLLCDPRSYDPANFYIDGFHPDDAGYAIFAQSFLAEMTTKPAPLPKTTCAQMALVSKTFSPLVRPLPNFERR